MLSVLKRQYKHLLVFFLLFGLVKSSVLIAPLLYSNIADIDSYGTLEYAIAFAGICSPWLNLGIHGAYPYFTLRKKIEGIDTIYFYHNLLIGCIQLLLLLLYFTNVLNFKFFLAGFFSAILALQLIISSSLKTFEKSSQSIFFDGGLFIALNVVNLFIYLHFHSATVFLSVLIAYSAALHIYSARHFQRTSDSSFQIAPVYKEVLSYSLPLVLSAFGMLFFVTGPRLLADALFGSEKTAIYSFFFRFASVVIMLHQSLNIFYFKKIYTYDPRVLDKYFALFLGVIGAISITCFLLVPPLLSSHFILLKQNYAAYADMYWAFSILMVFWVATALLENIIYRENLSMIYFRWQVVALVSGVITVAILWKLKMLPFNYIAFLHNIFFFLLVEAQCYSLKRQQIYFTKVRLVNLFMLLLFLAGFFLKYH